MSRRGDGLGLRGKTWWLDFTHQGNRHQARLGGNISRTVARELGSREASKALKHSLKRRQRDFLSGLRPTCRYCLQLLGGSFSGQKLGEIHSFLIEKHKQARIADAPRSRDQPGVFWPQRALQSLSGMKEIRRREPAPIGEEARRPIDSTALPQRRRRESAARPVRLTVEANCPPWDLRWSQDQCGGPEAEDRKRRHQEKTTHERGCLFQEPGHANDFATFETGGAVTGPDPRESRRAGV
jgi:hypothetical protein